MANDENTRALEYRRQTEARVTNQLTREIALAGSSSYLLTLEAAWEPLRNWSGWDASTSRVTEE